MVYPASTITSDLMIIRYSWMTVQENGGSYDGVDGNGLAFQTADGEYYALYTSGDDFFTEQSRSSAKP